MDSRSPLELVGHLLVGNLHLSAPSPGNGSTSAEETPQIIFLQYLIPDCEKGREVWILLSRDNIASFLQTVALLSVPFGKSKISQGSESENFSEGKTAQHSKEVNF